MVWWQPTYTRRSYRAWHEAIQFRMTGKTGAKLVDDHFIVDRFPEPINDRDSIRW